MDYNQFEDRLREMIELIPEHYFKNLQGVHCFAHNKPDPHNRGLIRMGEYLDPGFEGFMDSRIHIGRHINIYYGSFVAVAQHNSHFNWDEQLWEVLTHELQHHLESQANDQTLIEWDRQQLERFKNANKSLAHWQEFA